MQKYGKLFGVSVGPQYKVIRQWLDRGTGMVLAGVDVGYVFEGSSENLRQFKKTLSCCNKRNSSFELMPKELYRAVKHAKNRHHR